MTEKLPYKFLLALLVFTSQPGFSQLERSYSFEDVSLDPKYQADFLDERIWDIIRDKDGLL